MVRSRASLEVSETNASRGQEVTIPRQSRDVSRSKRLIGGANATPVYDHLKVAERGR